MVRRLQKKFPDLDKEVRLSARKGTLGGGGDLHAEVFVTVMMPPWLQELRLVLLEHEWNAQDALQALQVFSDHGASTATRRLLT